MEFFDMLAVVVLVMLFVSGFLAGIAVANWGRKQKMAERVNAAWHNGRRFGSAGWQGMSASAMLEWQAKYNIPFASEAEVKECRRIASIIMRMKL